MAKDVKYASKYRQTVGVDVGHLVKRGESVGQTVGARRQLAKAAQPETPSTRNAFQRVRDFLGLRTEGTLPAPNAEFVNGDVRHPFHQLGQGKPTQSLYDDNKLVAFLNTIAPKKRA